MTRVIRTIVLPSRDPRLKRNVNHDSMSRQYRVRPHAAALTSIRHESFIGVLDQLRLGSCVPNAGISVVYHHPFVSGVVKPWLYPPTEDGATQAYHDVTGIDPYAGQWPPDDTGSDGLSIAKLFKAKQIISGYLHAFTVDEALAQLMTTPLITGIPWLNSMFDTTSDGHAGHVSVNQTSGLAGGHELCVDELVVTGTDKRGWFVGGPNSWGPSWGDGGRWYLTVAEWQWLLAQDGDVTAFVPATQPTPEPTPAPATDPAGDALWAATGAWSRARHVDGNRAAALAVQQWAKSTGRL